MVYTYCVLFVSQHVEMSLDSGMLALAGESVVWQSTLVGSAFADLGCLGLMLYFKLKERNYEYFCHQ